ncbi:MAG: exosortase/archaeosortase family protein, partial [Thermodesulfobacteriota bacterium]
VYAKLTIPLQLFVSQTSTWLGAFFGLPIFREGNVIHLADKSLEVVKACSGLRSINPLLALSAIFGYFTLRANALRTVLFFSAIPAAIFINIVRVLLMMLAYHFFAYDLTKGTLHNLLGIVLFAFALAFVAGVQRILSIWDKPPNQIDRVNPV